MSPGAGIVLTRELAGAILDIADAVDISGTVVEWADDGGRKAWAAAFVAACNVAPDHPVADGDEWRVLREKMLEESR